MITIWVSRVNEIGDVSTVMLVAQNIAAVVDINGHPREGQISRSVVHLVGGQQWKITKSAAEVERDIERASAHKT